MMFLVLDVEHGLSVSLIDSKSDQAMLWDCGYSDDIRPSRVLKRLEIKTIRHLTITHYDEDHIGDLPNLQREFDIVSFHRNQTIPETDLIEEKTKDETPLSDAMKAALDMNKRYVHKGNTPDIENVKVRRFRNIYGSPFTDQNNLSLVSFVTANNTKIIIPGDLEEDGWRALLKNDDFREELKDVNIFVASHHGRENGYCKEVFSYCHPDVVVISDKSETHDTQKGMTSIYDSHIPQFRCVLNKKTGRAFFPTNINLYSLKENEEKRKVLTTRNDGSFYFMV